MDTRRRMEGMLSGYQGADEMREKAEKMFAPQMKGVRVTEVESMSSPNRTAIRPFNKGGKVHGLSREQSDLHLPKAMKASPAMKKGGLHKRSDTQKDYQSKNGKGKYGWGGFLGSGLGALAGGALGSLGGGVGAMPGALAGAGLGGKIGEYLPFKKGGKVCKKAAGGSIYTREMVGEKPTTKMPHFNYEAHMDGERKKMAVGGGAVKKMALGGVGKIRHEEATASGQQIGRRGKSLSKIMSGK